MRLREYRGPLGVLAAGVIGFSLLCSVSTMAMSDLNHRVFATLAPINIIDLAVNNLSTSAAFTQQAVTQFVRTPTVAPTNTAAPTPVQSSTAVRFVTVTSTQARRPRVPMPTAIDTSIPVKTNTPIPPTDVPPTETPVPTDTVAPTDTVLPPSDTPPPPPTDTDVPPPTNTDVPPTPTEAPIQVSSSSETPAP